MRGLMRVGVVLSLLPAAGCAISPSFVPRADLPVRHELEHVPFIAQSQYQCGPAALATVLQASGVAVDAEALIDAVYLPGRQGSLQAELVAATREYERLPYRLRADLNDVFAQVQAGHPVLVLQNLGLRHWPQWHFAVVVGFDLDRHEVVLRSGTERRHVMSLRKFMRTWEPGQHWAIVSLPTDQLPADPDPERYLMAAAGLEAIGKLETAAAAYETARRTWPDSLWPWLGLANVASLRKEPAKAVALYGEVLARDPTHGVAHYNLADALIGLHCRASARRHLAAAFAATPGAALQARIRARLEALTSEGNLADSAGCPVTPQASLTGET